MLLLDKANKQYRDWQQKL